MRSQDEQFLKALKIAPVKFKAAEPGDEEPDLFADDAPVPALLYSAMVGAYVKLDEENVVAHRMVKQLRGQLQHAYREIEHRSGMWQQERKNAERSQRAVYILSWMALILAIVAAIGWAV